MPKLIIDEGQGQREQLLDRDVTTVGRVAGNTIVVKVPEISRRHFQILREKNAFFIEDLGSSNGTRVNGRQIAKMELRDGDVISVGKLEVRFIENGEDPRLASGGPELEISLETPVEEAALAGLRGPREGERIPLDATRVTLGRNETNTISLNDAGLSGVHAEIVLEDGRRVIRDLGSTNGTFVDGTRIEEQRLEPGMKIRLGHSEFEYRVGAEAVEADAAPPATQMLEVVDVSTAEIERAEARYRKSDRILGIVAVLVLLGLLGGAVFLFMNKKTQHGPVLAVEHDPKNLLPASAAHFEAISQDEGDWEEADERIGAARSTRAAATGKWSLELKTKGAAAGGPARSPGLGDGTYIKPAYVRFNRPIPVRPGNSYKFQASLKTSGLSGVTGLAVVWAKDNGQVRRTDHLPLPADAAQGFVKLDRDLTPPPRALQLTLEVYVAGQGTVFVDDVSVLDIPQVDKAKMRSGGYTIAPDTAGSLTLEKGSDVVADHLGFLIVPEDGNAVPLDAVLDATGGTTVTDTSIKVQGRTRKVGTLPAMNVEMTVEPTPTGIMVSGKVDPAPPSLAFGLEVKPEYLTEGVTVVKQDGASRQGGPFRVDDVQSVIAGAERTRLALVAGERKTVALVAAGDRAYIFFPLEAAPGSAAAARQEVELAFEEKMNDALRLRAEARALEVQGSLGEAIVKNRTVVQRFPFDRQTVQEAEDAVTALLKNAQADLGVLETRTNDLLFFGTFRKRDGEKPVVEDLGRMEKRYAGTEIAASCKSLVEKINAAVTKARKARAEHDAETLYLRAKDFADAQPPDMELARLLLKQVVALGDDAGPWKAEAEKLLEKLK